jgi:tyrosinase
MQWASGNPTLTLPYWNYCDPNQCELPRLFRKPTVPNGNAIEPNPLYLPDSVTFTNDQGQPEVFPVRDAPLNQGLSQLSSSAVDVSIALTKTAFTTSAPTPAGEGFGSPRACGLTCSCGFGALEGSPHNKVHNAIGGSAVVVGRALRVGFMGDVSTAARDPVFWCHHANIDRLWESWLNGREPRANPTDAEWLDQKFIFYDYDEHNPQGKPFPVRPTPRDLLSTQALGYKYDRLENVPTAIAKRSVFLLGAEPSQVLAETETPRKPAGIPRARPHPMAAEEQTAIQLKADAPVKIAVPLVERMTPRRLQDAAAKGADETGGLLLTLEGIEFVPTPGVYYDVYLGPARDRDRLTPRSPYFVGSLTFFGLKHPPGSGQGGHHGPLTQRFLLPEPLRLKLERGDLDPAKLDVTFLTQTGTEPIRGKTIKRPKAVDRVVVTVRQIRISRSR